MAVRVIVELLAQPGRLADLVRVHDEIVAKYGPGSKGYLGSTRYRVPDNPDMLVEIADWESAEDRDRHMAEAAEKGVFGPLGALLAAPFRATVIAPIE